MNKRLQGIVFVSLGFGLGAHAEMNCGAEYQSTGEFDQGKNSPKTYLIPALKINTLNKIEGKERGVRISQPGNRIEITLVDGKDSSLGKSVLKGLSKKFELSIEVPVQSESETLKVKCTSKK